jgi:16S rRNA (guanine966-N2)-methyltransferase
MEALRFSQITEHDKYDLILADPPFFKDDIYEVVSSLLKGKYLNEEGMLVIERSIQTKEKDILNLCTEPFKIIGDACLYQITEPGKS